MRPYVSSVAATMSPAQSHVAEVVLASAVPPAASISFDDGGSVGPGAQPGVVDDDLRSFAGEQQRVLPADTATGPGHDGHLAVESTHV